MASISDFFVKDAANEGKKIDLYLPSGEKSNEWIVIYSIHSDAFVKAEHRAKVKLLESKADGKEVEFNQNELLADLIKSWSFDEPLSRENAFKFLENAPQIAAQINRLAGDTKFFYEKKPES